MRPLSVARRLFAGARVRILAAFIVLLTASEVVAFVAERQILLARTGERVDDSLVQEVDEFRRLVRDGRNPLDGEPFGGDVQEIFDVFLLRNVPGEGEEIFTFLGGRPYRSTTGDVSSRRLQLNYERLDVVFDTGLTIFAYTADPGTRSAEALALLGTLAATTAAERTSPAP